MAVPLHNHGLPIDYLKHRRRELAKALTEDDDVVPTAEQIEQLAALQQAIAALEDVKRELDGFY